MTRAVSGLLFTLSLVISPLEAQARIRFEEYTLPNGLHVILVPNHDTPLVTVDVWYRVGSRDEVPGKRRNTSLEPRRGGAKSTPCS